MKKETFRSYALFITAMLIFGTIGLFRRAVPLPSGIIAASRGILGAVCLCVFVKLRGKKLFAPLPKRDLILLVLSGIVMGANWIALFEAYNYTTVATATLCYYMQPTIVILLSPLVLREKLTLRRGLCAVVGIIGMVFVSGVIEAGGVGASDLTGILLGLSAAAMYACVVLINKKVLIDDAYEKTVIQLFSAGLAMAVYEALTAGISFAGITAGSAAILLVICLTHTGMAYAMYFGSMQGLSAQSAAALSYIDPVSALILSAVVLGERMTVIGIIGAVMIILSAFVSERQ